jgi:LDH2 family malate/lactate/ureidoglycolate dehydrogenase
MVKVDYKDLYQCVYKIFISLGETEEGARIETESLVNSDSRGVSTHGTYYLFPIVDRIKASLFNLPTKPTIILDNSNIAIVDGGNGLGQIAGKMAVDIAVKSAKRTGISMVLIRNTNNLGALAYYTEMIAKQQMIGIMTCNAAPAMAPWGGAEPFMGTNPMAIAFYTGQDLLFSADMASSVVARGKIRKAVAKGQPIPGDWALDAEGNQTTDPAAALKGTLLPIGGAKGSAIALAIDILSGVLSGAQYGPNVKTFHEPVGETGIGAMVIAIDICKFTPIEKYTSIMAEYLSKIKNVKKSNAAKEIFLPGEIEYRKELDGKANGVSLEEKTYEYINSLLREFRIDQPLEPKR